MERLILTGLLLGISFTDARSRRIPNSLCAAVALTGLLNFRGWDALLGSVVLPGAMLLLCLSSKLIIGGGDIKLVAALGFVLGLPGVFLSVYISIIAFLVVYLIFWRNAKHAYPLGPFLSAGALAVTWLPILIAGRNP